MKANPNEVFDPVDYAIRLRSNHHNAEATVRTAKAAFVQAFGDLTDEQRVEYNRRVYGA